MPALQIAHRQAHGLPLPLLPGRSIWGQCFPNKHQEQTPATFAINNWDKTPMFSTSRGKVRCCSASGVCIAQLRAASQPDFRTKISFPALRGQPTLHPKLVALGYCRVRTVQPDQELPLRPKSSALSQGLIQHSKKRTAALHRLEELAEFMPTDACSC